MNTKNHFYISAAKFELFMVDRTVFGVKIVRKRTFGTKKVDCEIVLLSNQYKLLQKIKTLLNERKKGCFEFYIKSWEIVWQGKRKFDTKLYIIAVHDEAEWKEKVSKLPIGKGLKEYDDYNDGLFGE